jgi:hypothetical protein
MYSTRRFGSRSVPILKKTVALLVAFTILTVVSVAGLAACGSGSSETTTASGATTTQAATTTTRPASTTTRPGATTSRPATGDLNWDDMPAYPGATQTQKGSWAVPPSEGDYSKFEWRYYETSDAIDKVGAFYKREMPVKGWEQTAWMDVQQMQWGSFMKNSEADAAMVWASSEGTKTVVAMWRGTK